jgi:hypothetical protein
MFIADCRLPIADLRVRRPPEEIGNRQLAIDNLSGSC